MFFWEVALHSIWITEDGELRGSVLSCEDCTVKSARPHPFDTKKVEVDFSKKSIFMDFRGKKSRLSSSKKVDLRILGAKKVDFYHQKIELKIFDALKGLV